MLAKGASVYRSTPRAVADLPLSVVFGFRNIHILFPCKRRIPRPHHVWDPFLEQLRGVSSLYANARSIYSRATILRGILGTSIMCFQVT